MCVCVCFVVWRARLLSWVHLKSNPAQSEEEEDEDEIEESIEAAAFDHKQVHRDTKTSNKTQTRDVTRLTRLCRTNLWRNSRTS